jgi:hypothetical protein
MFIKRSTKVFLVVVVLLALSTMAFAFAANLTIPSGGNAGSGGGDSMAGYIVTDVSYTPDATTPTIIATVHLTLDQAASIVKFRFNEGTWSSDTSCGTIDDNKKIWTCTDGVTTAELADELEVLAYTNSTP